MTTSEILKNQIAAAYGKGVINTSKELASVDLKNFGKLQLTKDLAIIIVFKSELHAQDRIVQLFFSSRIRSQYMRIYLSAKKFQAFPDYPSKTRGMKPFDIAMEYFAVFKSMHDALMDYENFNN